jgi:hypothetical protein
LAAAPKRVPPVSRCLGSECCNGVEVAGHAVVVGVTTHDSAEPAALFGNRQVSATLQLGFHLVQLRPEALAHGVTSKQETAAPRLRADMREAEEVERIRQPKTTACSVRGGVPPELCQPRLFWVQFQRELHEAFAKLGMEPFGVSLMLESDQEIVSKTHDDDVTARLPRPPLLYPQVEDVVQVQVRQ